ncbi:MAG: hypothetical protein Q4A07_11565, partial [Coriobacteriales bacterium]|nr:hypothetical protein [Coriobacteriales bacterium]
MKTRAFAEYSKQIRSTRPEIIREYLVPLIAEFVMLVVLLMAFMFFTGLGPMVQEPTMLGKMETKPTAGRLAYGIAATVLWFACTYVASRAADKDRHYDSSLMGFAAGLLLWQSVGEISWHFSVDGIHFVPLEKVTTFPLACLFLLLFVYGKRHHSFDWGMWCMLLSFAFNWFGHYITEGTYPFLSSMVDQHVWYVGVSIGAGVLGFAYSIVYLRFRAKTRRGRILGSMLTY